MLAFTQNIPAKNNPGARNHNISLKATYEVIITKETRKDPG